MNKSLYKTDYIVYAAEGRDLFDLLNRISSQECLKRDDLTAYRTILLNDKARVVDILHIIRINYEKAIVFLFKENTVEWIDRFVFTEILSFKKLNHTVYRYMGPIQFETSNVVFNVENEDEDFFIKASGENVFRITEKNLSSTASKNEYNLWRYENGIADFPDEINDKFIPSEIALVNDISLEKGCYTGQEIIARLDSYKKINKYLCHLISEKEIIRNEIISEENQILGKITGKAFHPERKLWEYLAVIHKSIAKPKIELSNNGYPLKIQSVFDNRSYYRYKGK